MAIFLSMMNIGSKKHWWNTYKPNKGQKISPEKEDEGENAGARVDGT